MTPSKQETVEIRRLKNDHFFYVPRRCEFTRIIVSLSRNDNQWLTSIGWRTEEKNVALNCDNTGDGLAIQIPEKFAKEIAQNDVLNISCQELGFQGQLVWTDDVPETNPIGDLLASDTISENLQNVSEISTKSAVPKKFLIGGVSAFAILAVVGVIFIGGGDKSAEDIQSSAKTEVIADATSVEDNRFKTDAVKTEVIESDADLTPKAMEDPAVESGDKDRAEKALADKKAQEEKNAIAAAQKAEAENERVAKIEREQIAKAELEKAKQARQKIEDQERQKLEQESIADLPVRNVQRAIQPKTPNSVDIKSMQKDLADMGYYKGAIDGVLSENTLSAVAIFRSIFEIPSSDTLDYAFLNEVKKQRAVYVRDIEQTVTATIDAPLPVLSEPVSVPSNPQPSTIAPIASPSSPPLEPVQSVVPEIVPVPVPEPSPEPVPTKIPETAPVIESVASLGADNIVPPKLLTRKAAIYPGRPSRKKRFNEPVTVEVSYGVDETGKAVDFEIFSNDHDGPYVEDFNRAALKVARSQKYRPGTSNGTPVPVDGLKLKVVFEK